MNYQKSGHCAKCGAPYYTLMGWPGITLPRPIHTCYCWNNDTLVTNTIGPKEPFVVSIEEEKNDS